MLKARILSDLKVAMKAGEKRKVAILRLLSSRIKDLEIEKRVREDGLCDEDVTCVLKRSIRQAEDSFSQYNLAGRQDLAEKEEFELLLMRAYMPKQMPEEEIEQEVSLAMETLGVSDRKGFGQIMKFLTGKLGAQADAKLISAVVGKKLSP